MYEQVEVGENLGAEHERSDPATSHEMGFDICGSSWEMVDLLSIGPWFIRIWNWIDYSYSRFVVD